MGSWYITWEKYVCEAFPPTETPFNCYVKYQKLFVHEDFFSVEPWLKDEGWRGWRLNDGSVMEEVWSRWGDENYPSQLLKFLWEELRKVKNFFLISLQTKFHSPMITPWWKFGVMVTIVLVTRARGNFKTKDTWHAPSPACLNTLDQFITFEQYFNLFVNLSAGDILTFYLMIILHFKEIYKKFDSLTGCLWQMKEVW